MKLLPKISVVTPSFNQGRFLEATLTSVLSQGYPDLELLVMDGGSTDGSVEILERHADRLAHWRSAPDGGHYAAINEGFGRATGDVLAWLNSDDLYFPWTLRSVATIFAELPEVQWLTSLRPGFVDHEGFVFDVHRIQGFSKVAFDEGRYLEEGGWPFFGFIQQESTFWRRSLWERAGGRIDTSYGLAGDFDLWARFYQLTELVGTPVPLAGFRMQRAQRSRDKERYLAEARTSLERSRETGAWADAKAALLPAAEAGPRAARYEGARVVRADVDSPESRWRLERYRFPEGVWL